MGENYLDMVPVIVIFFDEFQEVCRLPAVGVCQESGEEYGAIGPGQSDMDKIKSFSIGFKSRILTFKQGLHKSELRSYGNPLSL